jgi:pyrimidine deaminase RibD-like protein
MKFLEFTEKDYKIHDRKHLDQYLVKLCRLIFEGKHSDPNQYGMVAACILDPDHNVVYGINSATGDKTRRHAERVAMDRYVEQYGEIPEGSIIITTLSPCNEDDNEMADERYGESCTDLINNSLVRKVYCGYKDPSQDNEHNEYTLEETSDDRIKDICKKYANTFLKKDLDENFADGKHPGRKGLAKRSGVNTKASVSSLRDTAKHSSGEKQRMAHWLANMKSGKQK